MKFILLMCLAFVGCARNIDQIKSEPSRNIASASCNVPVKNQVTTKDNVTLSIKHFSNPAGQPLIMQHGLFANDRTFDVNFRNFSYAKFFCEHGFDVYVPNLRGTGTKGFESEMPKNAWTIDDYVLYDFPSIVSFVVNSTHKKPIIMAHSLGGWIASGYLQGVTTSNGEIINDISIARQRNAAIKSLILLAPAINVRESVSVFKAMANSTVMKEITKRFGIIRNDITNKFMEIMSKEMRSFCTKICSTSLFSLMYNGENIDTNALTLGASDFLGNSTGKVLYQFSKNIFLQKPVSFDGKFNYLKNIAYITVPTLTLAGDKDLLVNSTTLKEDIAVLHGDFEIIKGFGHIDFLIAKDVDKRLFPGLLNWIEKNN